MEFCESCGAQRIMTNVYVAQAWDYDSYSIFGVYTTLHVAQRVSVNAKGHENWDLFVTQMTINDEHADMLAMPEWKYNRDSQKWESL